MAACRERGVPLAVVNGRMTSSSYECYRIIRAMLRAAPPQRVLAMSGDDLARFSGIFEGAGEPVCRLERMPNIKFDLAARVLDDTWRRHRSCPDGNELRRRPPSAVRRGASGLVCFDPGAGGEQTLPRHTGTASEKSVLQHYRRSRHMHRVEPWRQRFHDLGLSCVSASSLDMNAPCESLAPGSIILWDRFGDLPYLYAAADAVYVGGAFGQGGQNFLEALAGGVVPCVGPGLGNFLWALGKDSPPDLVEAGLLRICRKSSEVRDHMIRETASRRTESERSGIRSRFRTWLAARTGGTVQAANALVQMLDERETIRRT